jgi:hypothetical protein
VSLERFWLLGASQAQGSHWQQRAGWRHGPKRGYATVNRAGRCDNVLGLRSLKLVRACRCQPDNRGRRSGQRRPPSIRHELTAAPSRLFGFYSRKFGLVGITLRVGNAERNECRHHRRIGTIRGHAICSARGRPSHLPEPDNHYHYRANDGAPDPRLNPCTNLQGSPPLWTLGRAGCAR